MSDKQKVALTIALLWLIAFGYYRVVMHKKETPQPNLPKVIVIEKVVQPEQKKEPTEIKLGPYKKGNNLPCAE